jgi:two-component system OmpR family response regulator
VRTLLRRRVSSAPVEDHLLRCADVVLDEDAHEVSRAGVAVDLTPTEFSLMRYLMLNAGRVVSKAQILDHVWHYDFGGDGAVVESYISYLRRKIDAPFDVPLIRTVRGVGYTLREPRDGAG